MAEHDRSPPFARICLDPRVALLQEGSITSFHQRTASRNQTSHAVLEMISRVAPIPIDTFNAVYRLTDLPVSGAREPEIKSNESGGKAPTPGFSWKVSWSKPTGIAKM